MTFTVTVFCGSAPGNDPVYVETATRVGATLADRGMDLVYGGGHVGLMGAVADGALSRGGRVTGVIPHALQAREAVHHEVSELILVDSMHERKMVMADRADAFLTLPGGPGTLEEISEQWTWAQLGIHEKPCGILNVEGYFDPFVEFVANMRDRGFTHPRFTEMLVVGNDLDEVLDRLAAYQPPTRDPRSPGAEMSAESVRP